MFEVFENEHDVTLNVIYAEPSEFETFRAENPDVRFDAVFTTDVFWLESLSQAGLTAPTVTEALAARVPEKLRDPEGRWIGVAQRPRVFHVPRYRLTPSRPDTYESLAGPEWEGRICTRSLEHSYTLQLLAAMTNNGGAAHARDWIEAVSRNLAQEPQGNDRAQIRNVAEGVCDLAIANAYYRGFMREDPEQRAFVDKTRVVIPSFAEGGTHVALSAAAVMAEARDPEAAGVFVAFLVSDLAQRLFMTFDYEHPVAPDVPLEGLVAKWGAVEPEALPLDLLATLREEAKQIVATLRPAN